MASTELMSSFTAITRPLMPNSGSGAPDVSSRIKHIAEYGCEQLPAITMRPSGSSAKACGLEEYTSSKGGSVTRPLPVPNDWSGALGCATAGGDVSTTKVATVSARVSHFESFMATLACRID